MGKTSILEAISMLSIPKSFRTSSTHEMIMFNSDYFRIIGLFEDAAGDNKKLEVGYQIEPTKKRVLKVDDVPKSTKEFLKHAYVVTFVPQDLYLLDLGPSKRREYLNRVLSKSDFMYLDHLTKYEKALRARNSVLKSIREGLADSSHLQPWDMQLIMHGSYLTKKRLEFLKNASKKVTKHYTEIADSKDHLTTIYMSKTHEIVDGQGEIEPTYNMDNFEEMYEKAFAVRLERDIASRTTSVGPHRDDFHFMLNEKNMENFASRGEKRTVILALKVTELEIIASHIGSTPILLLDDVFSELDNDRQTHLLELIAEYQTFITTNSPEHFENFSQEKAVWEVSEDGVEIIN